MKVEIFVVGGMEVNCYYLINEETKECLIVDPGECPDRLLNRISMMEYKPAGILLTHGHFDHIRGVDRMRKEYNIPVYAFEKEYVLLDDPKMNMSAYYGSSVVVKDVTYLKDNEILELVGCKIKVIATPGHTVGGCCYYIEEDNILFSGDTLFCASVGRTDFPTGSFPLMEAAIKERLFVLPDETVVYPGHMDVTTIQYEKTHNPFVRL